MAASGKPEERQGGVPSTWTREYEALGKKLEELTLAKAELAALPSERRAYFRSGTVWIQAPVADARLAVDGAASAVAERSLARILAPSPRV